MWQIRRPLGALSISELRAAAPIDSGVTRPNSSDGKASFSLRREEQGGDWKALIDRNTTRRNALLVGVDASLAERASEWLGYLSTSIVLMVGYWNSGGLAISTTYAARRRRRWNGRDLGGAWHRGRHLVNELE